VGRGRAAQLTREIPELEVGWWWVLVFCTTRTCDRLCSGQVFG